MWHFLQFSKSVGCLTNYHLVSGLLKNPTPSTVTKASWVSSSQSSAFSTTLFSVGASPLGNRQRNFKLFRETCCGCHRQAWVNEQGQVNMSGGAWTWVG